MYRTLCHKEIWVSPKIRVLPSGILCLELLDLKKFRHSKAMVYWCGQQTSSTVELANRLADHTTRASSASWLNSHTLVDCNPLSSLLRFVLDLSYKLFLRCYVAVGKVLTDTSRRAVPLRWQSFLYILPTLIPFLHFHCAIYY